MRGFVGSELDLKGRLFFGAPTVTPAGGGEGQQRGVLELGLAAQVLKDSGSAVASESMKRTVDDLVAGAQAKGSEAAKAVQAVQANLGKHAAKMAAGLQQKQAEVAAGLQQKQAEAERLLKSRVQSYTGRDEYAFGDLSRSLFKKMTGAASGGAVSDGAASGAAGGAARGEPDDKSKVE